MHCCCAPRSRCQWKPAALVMDTQQNHSACCLHRPVHGQGSTPASGSRVVEESEGGRHRGIQQPCAWSCSAGSAIAQCCALLYCIRGVCMVLGRAVSRVRSFFTATPPRLSCTADCFLVTDLSDCINNFISPPPCLCMDAASHEPRRATLASLTCHPSLCTCAPRPCRPHLVPHGSLPSLSQH